MSKKKQEKKAEKKLRKQMKKMLKAADVFDKEIMEIDSKIRKLPMNLSLEYNLEKNYFKGMPSLLISISKLQMISGAIIESLEPILFQPESETKSLSKETLLKMGKILKQRRKERRERDNNE